MYWVSKICKRVIAGNIWEHRPITEKRIMRRVRVQEEISKLVSNFKEANKKLIILKGNKSF
jgi:hypothetical protein